MCYGMDYGETKEERKRRKKQRSLVRLEGLVVNLQWRCEALGESTDPTHSGIPTLGTLVCAMVWRKGRGEEGEEEETEKSG